MANSTSLALVIIDGEQTGARAQLKVDKSFVIGSELGSDIVLRDVALVGQCFRLSVGDEFAQVEVLSGFVEIQGQQIAEHGRVTLHPYVPLKIGQTTLAYGEAEDERWHHLSQIRDDSTQNPGNSITVQQQNALPIKKYRGMLLGLVLILVSVGGGLIGMSTYSDNETANAMVKSQSDIANDIASDIVTVLEGSGFVGLKVTATEESGLLIEGNLETTAQRMLLEKILTELAVVFQLRVLVGEQLAATVQEIYRINGIKASVQSQDPGIVQVATKEASLKKLNRVVMIAKRDIVGLRDIVVKNIKPPRPKRRQSKSADDPGKRIVSLVPGNPAYITTVDGARYFVGAMMPSGHKISAISGQQVLLDKNGTKSTLKF